MFSRHFGKNAIKATAAFTSDDGCGEETGESYFVGVQGFFEGASASKVVNDYRGNVAHVFAVARFT